MDIITLGIPLPCLGLRGFHAQLTAAALAPAIIVLAILAISAALAFTASARESAMLATAETDRASVRGSVRGSTRGSTRDSGRPLERMSRGRLHGGDRDTWGDGGMWHPGREDATVDGAAVAESAEDEVPKIGRAHV